MAEFPNPVTYINQQKIEKAKKLLLTSSFSLIDIAFEVGFENRQNFFYEFKKITGYSPSTFKKDQINKKKEFWKNFKDD